MDITQIRRFLDQWLGPVETDGSALASADNDYNEAQVALMALRSLFEAELDRRQTVAPVAGPAGDDTDL